MNEAQTRAELIDPKLIESGWGVVEGSKILREYHLTLGRIRTGGKRAKPLIADYVLVYKDRKIAVIEAKSDELEVGEGVAQAKNYAEKLHIETTFSSNGKEIYQICMKTGAEGSIDRFPTPDELWNKTFAAQDHWRDTFSRVPFENLGGTKNIRYYQEIAVNNTMAAIAEEKQRILLTLATGTGKTFIAFQIAWKLFHTRWNLRHDGRRRPRILFLADRNILADQAFNDFSVFPEDALVRISPKEIAKKGSVPTNGSIFFTIFQTFMSGPENTPYFGEYPADYFDFIIIDECHRGGANDESNWRSIMEYFSPAVQLGLTATPKRNDNVDTYKYFGEPVYIYSLKEGINDGFLTPFKVKRIKTTLDDYIYTPDDQVIEGEVEEGKIYTEVDFNKIIEIKEREAKRVKIFLSEIDQKEKGIVFCTTQTHAAVVRDLINQYKDSNEPNYCVRVTANDGSLGEEYLRKFRDNENTIPTILTTSQKLSTGVDARNIRNIILMRPINSIIEFKQIVGRGTRLFDGKEYFTIYDFVDAYHHFADPEWDGEPLEPESKPELPKKVKDPKEPYISSKEDEKEAKKKLKIKLRDGKEREIQHMISTSFWSADGKPISAQEFLQNLFGILPEFFKDEKELRTIWSSPMTRSTFLEKLAEAGYGMDELTTLQKLIDAEKSDLFDVLEYVSFALQPVTREMRVNRAQSRIYEGLNEKQKEFLDFVLSKYIETGVGELSQDKLPGLLELKYHSISDAMTVLGGITKTRELFVGFQEYLYAPIVA
ncbi:Type I restriction-modification system, restriction subunit R [Methanosarcina siciliae HI350]|uniref:Type I restriction-modification system, restriction subunit R n=1 Tax=Methanosarcina siciliae HI350 TaxID=1434119 RepID=A0A0E3PCC7_9EURY|nr:type I restriction endonuclease subunit R [Methanosarcina siciliae]AKB31999.1 Type I restriction-modification system, restriction subunit R [Methanosarcina siciliae HI350]